MSNVDNQVSEIPEGQWHPTHDFRQQRQADAENFRHLNPWHLSSGSEKPIHDDKEHTTTGHRPGGNLGYILE
jgi:hypothetical protein